VHWLLLLLLLLFLAARCCCSPLHWLLLLLLISCKGRSLLLFLLLICVLNAWQLLNMRHPTIYQLPMLFTLLMLHISLQLLQPLMSISKQT
jgi:hypothetical protein